MKIALFALGCRANQAEIEELKQALAEKYRGVVFVSPKEKADIYVINSCSVTAGAERDTRRIFNRIKNQNPKSKTYALGCLRDKEQKNIDGYFKNWNDFIKSVEIKKTKKYSRGKNTAGKTKAFIKIQDGCNFNCTYCITRLLRGKSKSVSPREIIRQIKIQEKSGHKEIVLTGINILLYQSGQTDFYRLVQKILRETEVPRIRFGSLDPRLLNKKIISLWQNPRLMPHVHLSIQSGSEEILKKMKRPFPLKKIEEYITSFRKINPLFGFSCDIIAGFPGETEKDFKKSLDFVKRNKFFKIHAFPYSNRPGTEAMDFPGQILEATKKERMNRLLVMDTKLREKFMEKMIGKKTSVLWEGKRGGYWTGHTENFLKIKKKTNKNMRNKIEETKIKKSNLIKY